MMMLMLAALFCAPTLKMIKPPVIAVVSWLHTNNIFSVVRVFDITYAYVITGFKYSVRIIGTLTASAMVIILVRNILIAIVIDL